MIIHSPLTRIISQKTEFAGSKTVFRQSMVFEKYSGVAARTGISILVQSVDILIRSGIWKAGKKSCIRNAGFYRLSTHYK